MIDGLTKLLLLKYDSSSELLLEAPHASEEGVVKKARYELLLETQIALARLQGVPEFVIKLMEDTSDKHVNIRWFITSSDSVRNALHERSQ
jgi:hypothetical protein